MHVCALARSRHGSLRTPWADVAWRVLGDQPHIDARACDVDEGAEEAQNHDRPKRHRRSTAVRAPGYRSR